MHRMNCASTVYCEMAVKGYYYLVEAKRGAFFYCDRQITVWGTINALCILSVCHYYHLVLYHLFSTIMFRVTIVLLKNNELKMSGKLCKDMSRLGEIVMAVLATWKFKRRVNNSNQRRRDLWVTGFNWIHLKVYDLQRVYVEPVHNTIV